MYNVTNMSSCKGDGECLQQCDCDDTCNCEQRHNTTMIGGNQEWEIYHRKECLHNCELVECHNFKLCGKMLPQWLLYCHNGMCIDCAVSIGRIKFLNQKDDCPICLINNDMIEISCGKHKVCLECWKNWSDTTTQHPLTCPLCRESIWKRHSTTK